MSKKICEFLGSELGAVTVDWVVLTAAVTGIGLASASSIRTGTSALGSDINTALSRASVASLGELGSDGYNGRYVEASGRGLQTYEPGACGKSGCAAGTTITQMSYQMDDGSYWSMTSTQVDGQDAVVAWFDSNGDAVDAPRFRN